MKYTIRLEKAIQEKQFEPFRAEITQEYDSDQWNYENAVQNSLEQLDRIFVARAMQVEKNNAKPNFTKPKIEYTKRKQ